MINQEHCSPRTARKLMSASRRLFMMVQSQHLLSKAKTSASGCARRRLVHLIKKSSFHISQELVPNKSLLVAGGNEKNVSVCLFFISPGFRVQQHFAVRRNLAFHSAALMVLLI